MIIVKTNINTQKFTYGKFFNHIDVKGNLEMNRLARRADAKDRVDIMIF